MDAWYAEPQPAEPRDLPIAEPVQIDRVERVVEAGNSEVRFDFGLMRLDDLR